jgi:hypothetical protein
MALKHFFTGPWIKGDLLQAWLEQHGIEATIEAVDPAATDPDDLDREVRVLVPESDFPKAHALFFTEREGEL